MRILVISDLHCPFEAKGAANWLEQVADKFKPQEIVCSGDEIDSHGTSKYVKHPDLPGPGDELSLAVHALRQFYEIFPKVKVCRSNHTDRVYKKAVEIGIPRRWLKEIREALQAPRGWEWAEEFIVDGTLFHHGDGLSGQNAARQAAVVAGQPTVIGHVHSHANITYISSRAKTWWGMCVGCLVDIESLAYEYGKTMLYKPTLCCGLIDGGVPRLLPFGKMP